MHLFQAKYISVNSNELQFKVCLFFNTGVAISNNIVYNFFVLWAFLYLYVHTTVFRFYYGG
jgi:hypothetical protein